jgi:hypothetical protein
VKDRGREDEDMRWRMSLIQWTRMRLESCESLSMDIDPVERET